MSSFSSFEALPDSTLYHIATFAAAPTFRAAILIRCCNAGFCQQPISDSLWHTVLAGDYGIQDDASGSSRRTCQRLQRSLRQRVQEAHASVLQKTEIAYFLLAELTSHKNRKELLSKAKLVAILQDFGPVLRLSGTLRSGGVFLVEICRAKGVREATILKCVEYLVVQRKHNNAANHIQMMTCNCCNPNDITNESPSSRQTALAVAAARGMATVVQLLLDVGADRTIQCAGRYRLAFATKTCVSGKDWTALEFAMAMRNAEIHHGTHLRKLKGLDRCIELLQ